MCVRACASMCVCVVYGGQKTILVLLLRSFSHLKILNVILFFENFTHNMFGSNLLHPLLKFSHSPSNFPSQLHVYLVFKFFEGIYYFFEKNVYECFPEKCLRTLCAVPEGARRGHWVPWTGVNRCCKMPFESQGLTWDHRRINQGS